MSRSLESYVIKHWTRLEQEVASLRKRVASDAVHDLRVAVKKIRAASRVAGVRSALEPLAELYAACGAVREPEVLEGILAVMDRDTDMNTAALHRSLQARRRAAHRSVRTALEQASDSVLASVKAATLQPFTARSPTDLRATVKRLVKRRRLRLCSRIEHLHDEAVLHAVRKDLKFLSYMTPFMTSSRRDRSNNRDEQTADAESILGVVHDQQQLLVVVRLFPADRLDLATRRFLLRHLRRSVDSALLEISPRLSALCNRW